MARWKRIALVTVLALAASGIAWLSRGLHGDKAEWLSGMLANVSVFLVLLIPGEWISSRLLAGVERAEGSAKRAAVLSDKALGAAESAERSARDAKSLAESTAQSLENVREEILNRQRQEHQAKIDVYRRIQGDSSRDTLVAALRQAIDDEVISKRGVRVRLWETSLYYRYLVDPSDDALEVRLETAEGHVISTHRWDSDELNPPQFYEQLVNAVGTAARSGDSFGHAA